MLSRLVLKRTQQDMSPADDSDSEDQDEDEEDIDDAQSFASVDDLDGTPSPLHLT